MLQTPRLKRSGRKLISLTLTLVLVGLGLPSFAPSFARMAPKTVAQDPLIPVIAPGSAYRQTNLVSDVPGIAFVQDPLLVNPWGISMTSSSPFWVANNGTGTSTLYRGDVGGSPLVKNPGLAGITIPGVPVGLPTGTVANPSTTDFVVTSGSAGGRANFIFASITGHLTGWNPNVPAAGSTTAVIASSPPGGPFSRVYTGLAVGNNGSANFLYAADIANGKIDVFNSTFTLTTLAGNFTDTALPALPADYHPFNVQALGGELYVAYAKVDPMTGLDIKGFGAVSVFDFNGVFKRRIALNGPLSAPWGLVIAPASFGIFGNALLVGNFDFDGAARISAFNPTTGAFLGQLQDESGTTISIDGLWAIVFGNGGNGGDVNTLYFAAGIGEEEHGLFGSLKPTTASAASLIQLSTNDYAIGEGGGHIDITATRSGNVSGSATVNYATFDESQPGHASQKSDYEIALGKLTFNPGETSKTFRILIVDDGFVEGNEEIGLVLSNPTGAGAGLGSPNTAALTLLDNDSSPPTTNRIDEAQFFVRQQYLDFLNREPDAAGLAFWTTQITACGSDQECIDRKRIDVSAAFFLSTEFQETGFLSIRTHKAAFGNLPGAPVPVLYGQFMRDTQALQRDFVFGAPGADAQLEANKQAYFNEFITRPEFVTKYPSTLTNEQYVDNLLTSAGLSPSQVRHFVVNMTNAQENPPAIPTATGGGPRPASFGTARLTFNDAQTSMTFRSTVNNIDFTGSQTPGEANDNLAVAHIHAGAAVTPTTNGPVVWGFFGSPFNDNNPNDQVVIPFTTGVGGQINGKWDAPEGNNTTLAAQLSNLREGRAYVNFHTTQFSGGEVRGNIPAATSFRDALVAGLNATPATETRATVLRKISEAEELGLREFNSAFVLMEFFGYLRRDANAPPDTNFDGFNFWLNKLNAFNGDFRAAEMVKSFIRSSEYRLRFGAS